MMRDSAIPEAGSHGGHETKTAKNCRNSASDSVVGNHSAIDEKGDEPEESNATHNARAVIVFLVIRAGHEDLQLLLKRTRTSKHNQDEQLCTTKLLVEILVIQILMRSGSWIREIKTVIAQPKEKCL